MFISAGISIFTMWMISSYYSGIVVAKLPFEPWNIVKGMSHRGLTGADTHDVSAIFIYILFQMLLRGIPGKIMGVEGPRMPVDHQTPKWLQEYTK